MASQNLRSKLASARQNLGSLRQLARKGFEMMLCTPRTPKKIKEHFSVEVRANGIRRKTTPLLRLVTQSQAKAEQSAA